jgi:hypothetical protein
MRDGVEFRGLIRLLQKDWLRPRHPVRGLCYSTPELHPQYSEDQQRSVEATGLAIRSLVSDLSLGSPSSLVSAVDAATDRATHSEQKVDSIAQDIDSIKTLLRGLGLSPGTADVVHSRRSTAGEARLPQIGVFDAQFVTAGKTWDHPEHMIDFVRAVLGDLKRTEGDEKVVTALTDLDESMQRSRHTLPPHVPMGLDVEVQSQRMPPLEAILPVLRWVQGAFCHRDVSCSTLLELRVNDSFAC